MERNANNLSNPELLDAIARMQRENSRESREAVLDLVILRAHFLAPVTLGPGPAGEAPGSSIQFHLIPNQKGQPFFPAFTHWQELRRLYGPRNQQALVLTFDDYAGMILRDNRAAGFVINPRGACLTFERPMVEHLLRRRESRNAPR